MSHDMLDNSSYATDTSTRLARRTLLGTAAWAAPVVVVATAAPAFAASGDQIVLNSPPAAFTSGDWGFGPLSVVVRDRSANPLAGALVGFSSDQAWVSPRATTATTSTSGVATMLLQYNSVPTDDATAILTASYDTASSDGIVSVFWTLTYRPLTVAQRLALGNDAPAGTSVYRQVRGFIRGNQTNNTTIDTTSPWSGDTNFILGDTISASTVASTLPVELTAAGNLRSTWGLQTNPSRQNTRVDVTGDALAYFGKPGIKDDLSGTTISIQSS